MPPAFRFRPKELELVEFYLLPRARGQDPYPGVIIEDDAAGSSLPWDLFERHGLGSEDEAYFLVRTSEAKKPGARQDRSCDGGVGSWKIQSSLEKSLLVGGEKISCRKSNLNLHMGKGKNGGSVGWVMHEYSIAAPPCPSLVKICHIAFTGHGKKRKRVPDYQEDCQIGQALSQRARVVATAADQVPTQDDILPQSPLLASSDFLGFPSAASANAEQYQELEQQVPTTDEEKVMMPQLMVEYASADEQRSHLVLTDDSVLQSPYLNISDYLGFPSAAPANAEQYQDLEQQVPSTEEQQVMMPQLMVHTSADEERSQFVPTDDIFLLSPLLDVSDYLGFPSAEPANAEQYQELEQQVPSTAEEDVMMPQLMVYSSADEERSQLVLTNDDIFQQSPLLNSSDSLVFPSAATANAEQGQELEQQVPSTEEEQVMVPQLMEQQPSSMAELEQLNAGELGVDVHSSNFAEQEEFLSSIAVDNNRVVPRIGNMAGGHQDQQDFWSLSRAAGVQSNCAVPDMAAGVLGCA
uniref:NAC domain-containing protein n=1 Tax=Setaria italica TaxID=4555 RepID=K3Z0R4_SETIT